LTRKPPKRPPKSETTSLAFAAHHCCAAAEAGSALTLAMRIGDAKQIERYGVSPKRRSVGPTLRETLTSTSERSRIWFSL